MREIKFKTIVDSIVQLCADVNYVLPTDVLIALKKSIIFEKSLARTILEEIVENANIARNKQIPLCQDTGVVNIFVEIGNEVSIRNYNIYNAINYGVGLGYKEHYLRKSIVCDPIRRVNTNDNTPANIYLSLVAGDKIKISFLAKGGGSDNACAAKMFTPSSKWIDIKKFIVNVVASNGRNACPPLIIGVGIGGSFATVNHLASYTIFRTIGSKNENSFYREKEKELLTEINNLNIGPMNVGGKTTALAVFIKANQTHIASLPVAVNIQCHSCRRKTVII
ncbi:MAG: fumarate hydratase [Endomicrobium sp.]|nr:fumarate hydratase [Endomicrobium sp.]